MKKYILLICFLFIISCKIVTSPSDYNFPIIVVMFDDGRKSVFDTALPIMQKYNIKGTNAIVTKNIGSKSCLSWNQVTLLDTLYGWETASHTYSHPHLNELSETDFRFQMKKSKEDILAHHLTVNTLAIPYGTMKSKQYEIASEYYRNIRNSNNIHFSNTINRKFLGCFTVHKTTKLSEIYDRIFFAKEYDEPLVILLFHDIKNDESEYSYPPDKFEKLMKFIKSNNFKTSTLNKAVNFLVERRR